mgnify:FL=1
MAYMNQEKKAKIVSAVKPILKKYGVKATFAVRNHSTICLNVKAGNIDFIENYIQTGQRMSEDQVAFIRKNKSIDVNPYWFQDHFSGKAKSFLSEAFTAMKSAGNWYDRSDAQIDYFDTAYYVDVNIGSWKKPYEVI